MKGFAGQIAKDVEYAAELFRKAKHAIALTGAGISTPSGIPDFRSEGTGLWAKEEDMEAASLATFRYKPELFYKWFRPFAGQIVNASPNSGHIALAELEKAGYLRSVVTQNIDVLHQKAGSNHVIEMHGTLHTLSCTQCFHQVEAEPYLAPFIEDEQIPKCPKCDSILKPDVILFGEQLPQKAWLEAQNECRNCDLMLVTGSSLEVLPVAGLPMQALDRGAHLIIVNQTPTYLSVRADIVILEDVARILPAIAEQALNNGS
ncbi:MAG: hypothetical protein B5M51_01145 [Anaerolinea sp. 4484_236]|nr:MAG: hypothetical protein B5M51_01145 [Anaerolinea sp. 4484_236]